MWHTQRVSRQQRLSANSYPVATYWSPQTAVVLQEEIWRGNSIAVCIQICCFISNALLISSQLVCRPKQAKLSPKRLHYGYLWDLALNQDSFGAPRLNKVCHADLNGPASVPVICLTINFHNHNRLCAETRAATVSKTETLRTFFHVHYRLVHWTRTRLQCISTTKKSLRKKAFADTNKIAQLFSSSTTVWKVNGSPRVNLMTFSVANHIHLILFYSAVSPSLHWWTYSVRSEKTITVINHR